MKKTRIKRLAALLLAAALLSLAGCSGSSELVLPTMPPLQKEGVEETAEPLPSPAATADESEQSASPSPTVAPTATASPSPAPTPTATPKPSTGLSISGVTYPSDMVQYNVADLHGVITAAQGSVAWVKAELADSAGTVIQRCEYYPVQPSFSLAGTVNAELHFATLTPGTYTYTVTAASSADSSKAGETLINHSFTVYTEAEAASLSSKGVEYFPRLTDDTSNQGQIWNYFVGVFNNPYAAAAILANIQIESKCDPNTVEGDLTDSRSFSLGYTETVDKGYVDKNGFVNGSPGTGYGHGYGLCQWTGERKGELYDLCMERDTTVGSLSSQCEFILRELQEDYPELMELLATTKDYSAATLEFCNVYEQSPVRTGRTDAAKEFLEKYAA